MYECGKVFIRNDKWQVKLSDFFFAIPIQPFMNDSNSRNNNLQGFKNLWRDMGEVYDWGEVS